MSNQVEARAIQTKTIEEVCCFLLEGIIYCYGCVRKITTNKRELDAKKVREFFERMRIKLTFTMVYNAEAMIKVKKRLSSIVKALVKAYNGKASDWLKLLLFAL